MGQGQVGETNIILFFTYNKHVCGVYSCNLFLEVAFYTPLIACKNG